MNSNAKRLDALYASYAAASEQDRPDALARLVNALRESAWAISYKLLGRALPDVVTDAVSGAIQTLHTYQGKARFSTWFYSVVQIHCKMALIAKMEQPPEISLDELAEKGAEPTIEIENADNAKLDLDRLLHGMSESDIEILRLKAEGNTYHEIAAKLGITRSAANSRWRRLTARIEREKRVQDMHSAIRAASAE